MRILAIGLGTAGCRIVDSLYRKDQRSSNVSCVQALVIDVEGEDIARLTNLPDTSKIYFPPLASLHPDSEDATRTATVDIREVIARVQALDIGETDAIFICAGLGGSLVDVAPHIITALRTSLVEPIFGLVTLPCLAEGERRSAKAADDIDMLFPLLDGIILFDNETWYKKIKAQGATLGLKELGMAVRLGLKKEEPALSPEIATYTLLNEAIVRRVSLILRAGEFKADGGLELAEVVLDSGEVLNTMRGMGFITIGYAVERLPHHPFSFLSRWRPAGYFADEHQKKASRIVDLAKQAIYHEISTPCDITSAHKALILIAGPSHELSLKGYSTVRKWIDRSIAGLETRSGDYPVMNTTSVAIIVMLSGLENIPRIEELKDICTQYKNKHGELLPAIGGSVIQDALTGSIGTHKITMSGKKEITTGESRTKGLKDEMLAFTGKKSPSEGVDTFPVQRAAQRRPETDPTRSSRDRQPYRETGPDILKPARSSGTSSGTTPPLPLSGKETRAKGSDQIPKPAASRSKGVVPDKKDGEAEPLPQRRHRVMVSSDVKQDSETDSKTMTIKKGSVELRDRHALSQRDNLQKSREQERQRIEKELQRQRMMAMSGTRGRGEPEPAHKVSHEKQPLHIIRSRDEEGEQKQRAESVAPTQVLYRNQKKKTVIISKKALKHEHKTAEPDSGNAEPVTSETQITYRLTDDMKIALRDTLHQSKDELFDGGSLQMREPVKARDSSLLHTNLKHDKGAEIPEEKISGIKPSARPVELTPAQKKGDKKQKDDDEIS